MPARVRLLRVTVTAEVVVDDGESLTPLNVSPLILTPAQWREFDMDAQLATMQAAIDEQAD